MVFMARSPGEPLRVLRRIVDLPQAVDFVVHAPLHPVGVGRLGGPARHPRGRELLGPVLDFPDLGLVLVVYWEWWPMRSIRAVMTGYRHFPLRLRSSQVPVLVVSLCDVAAVICNVAHMHGRNGNVVLAWL